MEVAEPPAADRAGAAAWLGVAVIVSLLSAACLGALRWPAAAADEDPVQRLAALSQRIGAAPESARAALQRAVQSNPRDGRAWMLLAFAELRDERFAQAAEAIEQAVKVSRRVAADPAVWCEWADALGMAQGGTLAGRPTELIAAALALSATHPKALEMAGSAAYERRDFRGAVAYWERLLPQIEAGTRAHAELSAAIGRARRLAATSLPPG